MSISGNFLGPTWIELSQVIELDNTHFPHPWKSEEWLELRPDQYLLFQWKTETLLAFALFSRVVGDETAHLLKICLLPSIRGQGGAVNFWSQIVQQLRESGVKSIYLEVEESNKRAIAFYQKVGFQGLRIIKGFYSNGGNALTMQLML